MRRLLHLRGPLLGREAFAAAPIAAVSHLESQLR
jgi:hypothetical protein